MHDVGLHWNGKNVLTEFQLADNVTLNIIKINGWHNVPQKVLEHDLDSCYLTRLFLRI